MTNLTQEQQQSQEIVAPLPEKPDSINTEFLNAISLMVEELFGLPDGEE